MGHDITACRNGIEVAYNRRAAGNPLNQVLYLALGVMDEAYAGCSGNGEELEITLDQFRAACEALTCKNFEGMTREPNLYDSLVSLFKKAGATVIEQVYTSDDVSQERTFIEKCIVHLESTGQDSLKVCFA